MHYYIELGNGKAVRLLNYAPHHDIILGIRGKIPQISSHIIGVYVLRSKPCYVYATLQWHGKSLACTMGWAEANNTLPQ